MGLLSAFLVHLFWAQVAVASPEAKANASACANEKAGAVTADLSDSSCESKARRVVLEIACNKKSAYRRAPEACSELKVTGVFDLVTGRPTHRPAPSISANGIEQIEQRITLWQALSVTVEDVEATETVELEFLVFIAKQVSLDHQVEFECDLIDIEEMF